MSKRTGTVKWFNESKGFGFIVPSGGGKDVFLHITDLKKAGIEHVLEGEGLAFDVIDRKGDGRVTACKIERVSMDAAGVKEQPRVAEKLWWGYLHVDGGWQVKGFFDWEDIYDANESPFAKRVVEQPFLARGRDDALVKLKERIGDGSNNDQDRKA